jgi:serpin B
MTLSLLAACGGGTAVQSPRDETRSSLSRVTNPVVAGADAATLARDNAAFAVDLYRTLRAQPGNLVFSPTSLSLALAMTYAGAAGSTATEMATALHFTLPAAALHPAFDALELALESRGADAGSFALDFANATWADRALSLEPGFLDLLAVNYGAGVRRVDFLQPDAARDIINQWVSEKTEARVPALLQQSDLDGDTRLVLTNAVSFKADWASPFAAKSPAGTFHAPSGDVSARMMSGSDGAWLWQGAGYQAAALPYVGNAVSFIAAVPDAGTFESFEAGLTAETLQAVLSTDAATRTLGRLTLPRFSFAARFDVKDALEALGMIAAFDSGSADFSGIDGGHDLYVKKVIHQATIAVDEKGTEAAAASAVVINRKAALLTTLVVDRPFLFFIRDDATGALLFAGRVLEPPVAE